jgi:hypothetical protein
MQPGVPQELFDAAYVNFSHTTNYLAFAVSPDGQRFLIPRLETAITTTQGAITVVLNWTAALKKK